MTCVLRRTSRRCRAPVHDLRRADQRTLLAVQNCESSRLHVVPTRVRSFASSRFPHRGNRRSRSFGRASGRILGIGSLRPVDRESESHCWRLPCGTRFEQGFATSCTPSGNWPRIPVHLPVHAVQVADVVLAVDILVFPCAAAFPDTPAGGPKQSRSAEPGSAGDPFTFAAR